MSATTPTLDGTQLVLRPLGEDDVTEEYVAWLRDPDVVAYLESRFDEHDRESTRRYVGAMAARDDVHLFAIVDRASGRHIGNIKLGPVDAHHRLADIGIMIGAREFWGRGCATDAIATLTTWALGPLGLRKVAAGAYAPNVASVRAFERAGFEVEAVRPRHAIGPDGTEVDAVLLGRHA